MTHHIWGDDWFEKNGGDLYDAQVYIIEYVKRWSGCYVSLKEKYGTIRYEWVCPQGYGEYFKLPGMLDKRTSYGRIPRYLWCWDYSNPLYRCWVRYGKWVLTRAIKKACKKWPNIADELTDYADERGVSISAAESEDLLIKAMDYSESLNFKGVKNQELQWPLADVEIDGYYVNDDTIPIELKEAEVQIALSIEIEYTDGSASKDHYN